MSKEIKITATQKKKDIKLTEYQLSILDSMSAMKSCDIIVSVSVNKNRTPGPQVLKMEYNGDGFIRSLFKK